MLGRPPVEYAGVTRSVLRGFATALKAAEASRSEKPMQKFLEAHPVALVSLVGPPHRIWVLPRQALGRALGGGWQPDFLVCDWNSNGPQWTIIELESPTAQVINSRGISHKCREAQQQISDYRRHLKENWKDLQINGLIGAHHQRRSLIVIGRREVYDQRNRDRVVDLRNDDIEVASYDRLYAQLSRMVDFRVADRTATKKWMAAWRRKQS